VQNLQFIRFLFITFRTNY